MQEGFARMENRLEQLYNHVDGFISFTILTPKVPLRRYKLEDLP
jgi:hypothetical protein